MSNWYLQFTASTLGCQSARVQPTASVPTREQQENSFGGVPKGCDPKEQSYCSVLQTVSKTGASAAALHWCCCPRSLPAYCQPHGAGQPRRGNGAPPSHPKSYPEARVSFAVHPWDTTGVLLRCWPVLALRQPEDAHCPRTFHEGVQAPG